LYSLTKKENIDVAKEVFIVTTISKTLSPNPFKLTNLLSISHPLARKAKGK
jgi:hypothetical protein